MTPIQLNLITIGGCTFTPLAIAGIDWDAYPDFFDFLGLPVPEETTELASADNFIPSITLMFVGGGEYEFVKGGAAQFCDWFMQITGRQQIQPASLSDLPFGKGPRG